MLKPRGVYISFYLGVSLEIIKEMEQKSNFVKNTIIFGLKKFPQNLIVCWGHDSLFLFCVLNLHLYVYISRYIISPDTRIMPPCFSCIFLVPSSLLRVKKSYLHIRYSPCLNTRKMFKAKLQTEQNWMLHTFKSSALSVFEGTGDKMQEGEL